MTLPRPSLIAILVITISLELWSLEPAAADGIAGTRALLFWALHIVVLLPLLYLAQSFILWLQFGKWLVPVATVALSGLVGALAFTPFAMVIDRLFAASNDAADNGPLLFRAAGEFLNFIFPVTVIWLLVNARQLSRLSVPRLTAIAEPDAAGLTPDEKSFWSLVPATLGHDLVALSAEQHYVRVVTAKGDTLVLFAFGRALAAVERFDGMRIHRSHWVRLVHVADLSGTTRDLRCRLSNGQILPVSRMQAAPLRAKLDARRMSAIASQGDEIRT